PARQWLERGGDPFGHGLGRLRPVAVGGGDLRLRVRALPRRRAPLRIRVLGAGPRFQPARGHRGGARGVVVRRGRDPARQRRRHHRHEDGPAGLHPAWPAVPARAVGRRGCGRRARAPGDRRDPRVAAARRPAGAGAARARQRPGAAGVQQCALRGRGARGRARRALLAGAQCRALRRLPRFPRLRQPLRADAALRVRRARPAGRAPGYRHRAAGGRRHCDHAARRRTPDRDGPGDPALAGHRETGSVGRTRRRLWAGDTAGAGAGCVRRARSRRAWHAWRMSDPRPPRRHFSMLREFHLADWFTLGNAFCGTGAVLAAMRFLKEGVVRDLLWGMALIPLAFVFDALDGRIARWRKVASTLGRELDSLADVISFGVAPAALGYACGLQGGWDWLVLSYFVGCGVSRLARYNVTAESLS